ncbi:sigma-54-dependent Fis family transcriptional regulator [Herbaspirillum sp. RTI4]|uniref:sigma-54-dependent Fis family transcriptional regulator n=1 Tax=Herbaspirillum sp. RTI4 TaxID=3048640 RepID=UPI002AB588B3|nr:sigma-54-dependent Fis family transcriptional regulator [Herbaspirillum sp. RTI4]MDY7577226.1 sigma-54-dependent Fis family transcriptional regulator [Herbaspirillum sp. RTI4]MEA9980516.1 sigma-54-dependent Fis family transcriptional regulator [Herbaspirillum sp. RTI4]
MMLNPPDQRHSNPRNDQKIMAAWEGFVSGHAPHANALRCLIDDSWRRCLDVQVDPTRRQAPAPVNEDILTSLQHQHRELLSAGKQVMAMARDFLAETGTIMILTDPNGMILGVEGDYRALASAESIHLITGSNWNEGVCGTNAIGTALSIGQPVQIHASEHFCAGVKQWTCSATVIRDPYDGAILGAVDVSGLGQTFNPHSLALAVTTASRIESQLAQLEMDVRYHLLERGMAKITTGTDGVIICDRRGYPIKANEQAATALLERGIDYDLKIKTLIPTLRTGTFASPTSICAPEWLSADWIEPIIEAGERIGTLLTIPRMPQYANTSGFSRKERSAKVAMTSDIKGFAGIVGNSTVLAQAVQKAKLLARTNVPVLLLGETGVGKENFAQGIHRSGHTEERPFVTLNCGGLSKDLLAGELFGHCEGAFTGSRRGGMIGKVEAANGGTLFLDEIGEMPLELQPHFLRVLEEGEIYRIGETTPRKIAFKLITATNRSLREEVAEGRFRMDLFYRVSVTSITIPPLRERAIDIAPLVEHFLQKFAAKYALGAKRIAPEVIAALKLHAWPGNVRELRNVIESMFLTTVGETLGLSELPPEIGMAGIAGIVIPSGTPIVTAGSSAAAGTLEDAELKSIREVLESDHGNLTLVARHLGIAKSTLYVKLKKYGLDQVVSGARGQPLH